MLNNQLTIAKTRFQCMKTLQNVNCQLTVGEGGGSRKSSQLRTLGPSKCGPSDLQTSPKFALVISKIADLRTLEGCTYGPVDPVRVRGCTMAVFSNSTKMKFPTSGSCQSLYKMTSGCASLNFSMREAMS